MPTSDGPLLEERVVATVVDGDPALSEVERRKLSELLAKALASSE